MAQTTAEPELFPDDGLHPSLAGQKVIVWALVKTLAGDGINSIPMNLHAKIVMEQVVRVVLLA